MVIVLGFCLLVSVVASLPESTSRCSFGGGEGRSDHLPHPTDCSRYLTCVGSIAVEQRCPDGLQWNTLEDACDTPDVAKCSPPSLPAGSRQSASVVGKCPPQLNRCPVAANPMEELIFMPHGDCRKFYACASSGAVELSCPRKLYWNHETCRCDYGRPIGSDCVADTVQPTDTSVHSRVRRAEEVTTTESPLPSSATIRGISSVMVLIGTMVLNL